MYIKRSYIDACQIVPICMRQDPIWAWNFGLDTRTMRAPKVLYGGRLELHHPKLESLNS